MSVTINSKSLSMGRSGEAACVVGPGEKRWTNNARMERTSTVTLEGCTIQRRRSRKRRRRGALGNFVMCQQAH